MCWSGEASAAVATFGIAVTLYSACVKKDSKLIWLPLGYFTLMELLQAFTYLSIDNCAAPSNQVSTVLGYLHITFQPFFINMISLYFIDKRVARKIAPFAYGACFIAAIIMLIKLYPFSWAPMCDPATRPMCATELCSFHGNWHIAWGLPINELLYFIPSYAIVGFIMPALYGSWRFTLWHFLAGPLLAWMTTDNIHEWPAIWCLFSLELLLIVTSTRFRSWMFVRRWPCWDWIKRPRKVKLAR